MAGPYRPLNSSEKSTLSYTVAYRHFPASNHSLYLELHCIYSPSFVFFLRLSPGSNFPFTRCCSAASSCLYSLFPFSLAVSTTCHFLPSAALFHNRHPLPSLSPSPAKMSQCSSLASELALKFFTLREETTDIYDCGCGVIR